MKRVLVIHYSQTGQLTDVLGRITKPLVEAGIQVDQLPLRPEKPFLFPWSWTGFFNVFPECVGHDPIPLEPFEAPTEGPYDLVILGYTIWFLNPSLPTNAFLSHPRAPVLLNGRPVLTVIAPRNMWVMAQEYVRGRISAAGGKPVGNIAVVDRSGNLTSVITIIRWMFRGKKDPFLVFPRAGIRQEDIDGAARFGPIIAEHVKKGTIAELNPALLATGAARIAPTLLILERRALFVFGKWRRFILAKADRDPSSRIRRVKFFSRALPVLIFIVSPISGLSVRLMGLLRGARLRAEIARFLTY